MPEERNTEENALRETSPVYCVTASEESDIDLSLLEDGLTMTPWERMQANDDILNFGESLRSAMEKRHAKPQ